MEQTPKQVLSNPGLHIDTLASHRFVSPVTRTVMSLRLPGGTCVRSEEPTGHFRVQARPQSLPLFPCIYT